MTRLRIFLLALLAAGTVAATAGAIALDERTYRASEAVNGRDADGHSSRPAVSPDGRTMAFDSTATNLDADLNGAVRDVFVRRLATSRTTLVSEGLAGGADGDSHSASLSGEKVAFASKATNLVPGDTNGRQDVFVRALPDPPERVSVPAGGGEADGDSGEPDLSADGRFVAFSSSASNLVPGDANGTDDVFVRDLTTGVIERISDVGGRAGEGRSHAPAISGDGRFVAFVSDAPDLVRGDTNFVQDVFVRDRQTGTTELISVSSRELQQDEAVAKGFSQVADISLTGRYVVFDSDASNLVRGDFNRDTDVFLRDRRRGRTERVSVSTYGVEGDNDSFYPSISADGRHVVFNSFAENLVRGDARGEDVFSRDLELDATTLVSVTARGRRRGPERVRQLLQRPAISQDGDVIGFTSTADNLVAGDSNGLEDTFVRVLVPPSSRIANGPSGTVRTARPSFRIALDDPAADRALCTIDGKPFECGLRGRIPAVGDGAHVLRVRAGGPGMRYEEAPSVRRFRVAGVGKRRRPLIVPRARITRPKGKRFTGRVIRGSARGGAGVVRVEVLVALNRKGRCRFYDGERWARRGCRDLIWVVAEGTDRWRLKLPRMEHRGLVVARARAVDRSGNYSRAALRFYRR